MPNDRIDWRLLDKFLAGECTPAEDADVRRWLANDAKRTAAIVAARDAVRGSDSTSSDADIGWQRLAARIGAGAGRASPVVRPAARTVVSHRPSPRLWASPVWRIAAVVVVLLSAAAVWWLGRGHDRSQPLALLKDASTRKGERSTILLPDGTRITLGVESRLRFDSALSGRTRDVHLTGEALFRVTHQPERPFIVHAAGAETRVLGTEFSVRAYPSTSRVQVVVASGTVSIGRPSHAGAPTILRRGQLGVLDEDGTATVQDSVNLDRYLAWTIGQLRFDDVTLSDALPELERWFDVRFTASDTALARRRFALVFRGDSLAPLLDALSLALDARHERRRDTVLFTPNR